MYGLNNFNNVLQLRHHALRKPQADNCKTSFWALTRCVLSMSWKWVHITQSKDRHSWTVLDDIDLKSGSTSCMAGNRTLHLDKLNLRSRRTFIMIETQHLHHDRKTYKTCMYCPKLCQSSGAGKQQMHQPRATKISNQDVQSNTCMKCAAKSIKLTTACTARQHDQSLTDMHCYNE